MGVYLVNPGLDVTVPDELAQALVRAAQDQGGGEERDDPAALFRDVLLEGALLRRSDERVQHAALNDQKDEIVPPVSLGPSAEGAAI